MKKHFPLQTLDSRQLLSGAHDHSNGHDFGIQYRVEESGRTFWGKICGLALEGQQEVCKDALKDLEVSTAKLATVFWGKVGWGPIAAITVTA